MMLISECYMPYNLHAGVGRVYKNTMYMDQPQHPCISSTKPTKHPFHLLPMGGLDWLGPTCIPRSMVVLLNSNFSNDHHVHIIAVLKHPWLPLATSSPPSIDGLIHHGAGDNMQEGRSSKSSH